MSGAMGWPGWRELHDERSAKEKLFEELKRLVPTR
jgi:hypothetical protein